MGNLRGKMATGAAWMILAKLTERGLGFFSTLVLARLLLPRDFGLVAMAMTIVTLLELVNAFGFDTAIIREQEATTEHYNTAWTLNVLLGVVICAVLLLVAEPAAWFYNESRLSAIMIFFGVGSLVQGLENIGVVAFRKELDFRKEFIFFGGKKMVMFIVTIPMAILFKNYWALAVGSVVGRIAGVIISYKVHPYRPRFSLKRWRDLVGFSRWLLLSNFIGFVRLRYADLVLGRMAGPLSLGLYSMGSEIALLPSTEFVMPINRAALPAYAKLARDPRGMKSEYRSVIGMIAVFALPAALGISAVAPLAVSVLLGEKWLAVTPVLQVLAWVGAIQAIQSTAAPVFLVGPRPWLLSLTGGLHAALLVALLPLFALRDGINGAAVGTLLSWAIVFPVTLALLMAEIRMKVSELAGVTWRPLFAAGIMFEVVRAWGGAVGGFPETIRLFTAVGVGVIAYTSMISAFWCMSRCPRDSAESVILSRLLHVARMSWAFGTPPQDLR